MKKHVSAWAVFEADVEEGTIAEIRLAQIPFPPKDNALLLLPNRGQGATDAERKQAFRAASLRWHPGQVHAAVRWAAERRRARRDS